MKRIAVILLTVIAQGVLDVNAGGGPQHVLLVVNQARTNSVVLGRHYAQRRGIPDRQILRLAITNERNIEVSAWSNLVYQPVMTYLDESGLDAQIDYIVFSSDFPYRIYVGPYSDSVHAGFTSAMYYGVYTSPNAFVAGCNLAAGSSSAYADSSQAFRRPDPPVNTRYRITAQLDAWTPAQAMTLVDRAADSDFTRPDGVVYFEHGLDDRRNGRWPGYEEAAFQMLLTGGGAVPRLIDDFGNTEPRTNAIGLMTGLQVYSRFATTEFIPGALADHLTSFSGFLFNNTEGEGYREAFQMKLPTWISNGVAGTYGTVVEPCAYPEKFSSPRLHFWYGRGFSLGESFYMAVKNPYQGVLLGDPLAQPYAHPPVVELSGFDEDATVAGLLAVTVTARVDTAQGGVDRIDLYVDDLFYETIHRLSPAVSNTVTVTIHGEVVTYAVAGDDTLITIADGLAAAINSSPDELPVVAQALGEAVMLRQINPGEPGTSITYSVAMDAEGMMAWTAGAMLMESPFHAFVTSRLSGVVQSGDVFRAVVTRLDGVQVTNDVVAASSSWNARSVMQALREAINADPDLQGAEGISAGRYSHDVYGTTRAELVFQARTPGWAGYAPAITLTSVNPAVTFSGGGMFNHNTNTLTARGLIFLSAGTGDTAVAYSLDTTSLPDGPQALRAVAHHGDGPATQGHDQRAVRIKNHNLVGAITNPLPFAEQSIALTGRVDVVVDDPSAAITGVVLWVEGKPVAAMDVAPFVFTWNPADYGLGPVTLQARAFNDAGQSTHSDPVTVLIIEHPFTGRGTPHAWLVGYGFTNNFEAADVSDPDEDGTLTWQEYVMGTDPLDGNSYLRLTGVETAPEGNVFSWSAVTGRVYTLEWAGAFDLPWLTVTGLVQIPGQAPWLQITNQVVGGADAAYYRVLVEMPP